MKGVPPEKGGVSREVELMGSGFGVVLGYRTLKMGKNKQTKEQQIVILSGFQSKLLPLF